MVDALGQRNFDDRIACTATWTSSGVRWGRFGFPTEGHTAGHNVAVVKILSRHKHEEERAVADPRQLRVGYRVRT